jgi:glucans biosynthesis protein
MLVVVLLLFGINYQNTLAYILAFWLFSLGVVVLLRTWRNLLGVRVALRLPEEVFAGGEAGGGEADLQFHRLPRPLGQGDLAGVLEARAGVVGSNHRPHLVAVDLRDEGGAVRGVGRDDGFGLSARGVAIDTGQPSGEEFPSFTEFWLEKPAVDTGQVVVYALLDGPSLTGAYRFTVRPGDTLEMDVQARLFFRKEVELPGYAPLTSMFYYGENTLRPDGEWRPQTHDSDGLLVVSGDSGEWLWRPLINPASLRVSYLRTNDPKGFGLIQRDRDFRDFQDLEARYERRPSAWVRPGAEWGHGNVVLVEIPTRSEVNDNVVAFWSPVDSPEAGEAVDLTYTLSFGPPGVSGHPSGMAMNTFLGDGNRIGGGDQEGAYRVLVDFAGGPLDNLDAGADVVSQVSAGDGTEVLEHFVEYSEPAGQWRLSMLVRPAPDQNLALRAYLSRGGEPLTETWTYELPPGVDIRAQ